MVATVFYLLGCVSVAAFSLKSSPFVASRVQFAVSALLVAIVIALAFLLFDRLDVAKVPADWPPAPSQALVFGLTVILASAYLSAEPFARSHGLGPVVPLAFRLAGEAVAAVLYWTWAQRRDWTPLHYLAIAAGTALTYFAFGLNVILGGHTNLGTPTNAVDIVGQVVLGVAVLGLIVIGARRNPGVRV